MKKILSLSLALAMLASAGTASVFAEDNTAEPADIPKSVYDQFMEREMDTDKDGVLSEEEFENATYISADLTGVDSIDFLLRLKAPRYMYLYNGDIADFSALGKFRTLETLQISNMPNVTDISFAKDMGLLKFYIVDLEQITDEQKIEVMDTSVGYSGLIGATPRGMFTYDELTLEIEDTDIANFELYSENPALTELGSVYGKKAGTTSYSLKLHDKEIYSGKITVGETVPDTLMELPRSEKPVVKESYIYSGDKGKVLLINNTLYIMENGDIEPIAEKVADFDKNSTYDDKGKFTSIETILFQDGTAEVNGEKLYVEDGAKFKAIGREMCISESGDVYSIHKVGDRFEAEVIYNGFGRFLENSSMNFVSDTGELIQIELKRSDEGDYCGYQAFPTGIMNVVDSYNSFFIDENKVLWYVSRNVGSAPKAVKKAEDVVFVGYRHYSDGTVYGCVHITSDGTAYEAGTTRKVILSDDPHESDDYKIAGQFAAELPFSSSGYISGVSGFDFHITNDNVLCMEYDGHKKAIANVDSYVAARAGSDGKTVYVYFVTNDGMLWSYSFGTQEATALVNRSVIQPVLPDGDVNGDGKFDVADAVLLQKWLLGVPDTHLVHWKAGDLCNDNKLDVYDFCAMKSELANSRS